jgi:putative peptidoglycan lipid II flippase
MKTPVRIGIIAVVSNMLMSVVLVFFFQHAGLALATSLAAFVNAGLLFRTLVKTGGYVPQPGWASFLIKVVMANAVIGLVYYYDHVAAQWYEWSAFDRAINLTGEIVVIVILYVISCFLVGIRPRHVALQSAS